MKFFEECQGRKEVRRPDIVGNIWVEDRYSDCRLNCFSLSLDGVLKSLKIFDIIIIVKKIIKLN